MLKAHDVIRQSLQTMAQRFGDFEQTSHGVIIGHPTIRSVATALVDAYERPSAYSISELSQHIEAFLRVERSCST